MPKERLDVLVVQRGLADSRDQAQRLIRVGAIRVSGHPATKPGHRYDVGVDIEAIASPRFVSRGGEKLEAAFQSFGLDVRGRSCLDIGASTGGFTDCLLQHGAERVIAVDVGRGQLAWTLRNDPRVTVMERVNARYLQKDDLDVEPGFAVVDVAFISLTKVLPAVIHVLAPGAQIITLIKPQFEAGRDQVAKGGVVRDPAVREAVVQRIRAFGTGELKLEWLNVHESPLRGPAGNVEYLAHWQRTTDP